MLGMSPLMKLGQAEAVCLAALLVVLMGVAIIGLGWMPHLALLAALVVLLLFGLAKKVAFGEMQTRMAAAVAAGMGAVYLFFFIGLLVSALMMSGAIPTLMYYGFVLLSPQYFYVSVFVLTALIGIAIGSSLTTCATLGVAFVGMSGALGADAAMTAGAIVSGAFFGDKMSPLSDTTGIAASIVGVDLFEHIRNMAYTTVPAFVLTVMLLWWFSTGLASGDLSRMASFQQELMHTGLVHGYALLPFGVLVGLAIKKVKAILAILATVAVALVVTYMHSSPSLADLGRYFFAGFELDGAFGQINSLISRGGIQSMFFTQTIVVLALSLGGLLFALGVIPALLGAMRAMLTNAARATSSVAATSIGVNVLIGEQYLSLLLAGETFKPVYDDLGLHRRNLSRTLEDAGTVINPLVPWGVCGVFISHTLGVPVLDYLPYAFFCYLSLMLTLVFGLSGWTISRQSKAG